MINALVYDLEIVKAIAKKGEKRVEGVAYCNGWDDHGNMGISVLGAYDYQEDRYRVFCGDNLDEFIELAKQRELLVSFNGLSFDNKVILACMPGVTFAESAGDYDILVEIWRAAGLGPKFAYPSHTGYGLDAVCERNFGIRKTGDGALAPVHWQQGKIGKVIDYCLSDVYLTKQLFDAICDRGWITCPKTGGQLAMRHPLGQASEAAATPSASSPQ
jgi:hypothetical protein